MPELPDFASFGIVGVTFAMMAWWIWLLHEDLKQERADHLRCQAEKEDIMRDYMIKPHELGTHDDR